MRCRDELSAAMETLSLPAVCAISNRCEAAQKGQVLPSARKAERKMKCGAAGTGSAAHCIALCAREVEAALENQFEFRAFLERHFLPQPGCDHIGRGSGRRRSHGRLFFVFFHSST